MGQRLYIEGYSGISGDMTVAALLDLGADQAVLERGIASLGISGYHLVVSRVKKSGIDACDFDVVLDEEHENHDHDMGYLHGHEQNHVHDHAHTHHHEHTHDHAHAGHSEEHVHMHRGLDEIMELIHKAQITDRAKTIAEKIFRILAEAEAKAHGVNVEQVHFHEVGAVDSIVDIVGAAICFDNLNVEEVIVKELYEGQGTIRCQHGIIPVPVPAVMNIVQQQKLSLHITEVQGELVTPTGAAIVAAMRTTDQLPENFTVKKVGIGAGKRNYPTPGFLRIMMI
ncbi:LarC family nickel insertion protein [Blautia sp. MSJ-19]|uniref:LarC family nickel insertion protein n=1 Tax=Blautia sp. MSJ-19 TaxID=2841517 RepID=UPI001C0EB4B5|nr:LarC family nickel insertion protein [Blautia sp. MSJ-19]